MLFLFSWLMLPLFKRLRQDTNIMPRLAEIFGKPGMIFLFFVPVALVEMVVNQFPDTLGGVTSEVGVR
jgi:hypothetical protein